MTLAAEAWVVVGMVVATVGLGCWLRDMWRFRQLNRRSRLQPFIGSEWLADDLFAEWKRNRSRPTPPAAVRMLAEQWTDRDGLEVSWMLPARTPDHEKAA